MPRSELSPRESFPFLYTPRWTGRCFPLSSSSPLPSKQFPAPSGSHCTWRGHPAPKEGSGCTRATSFQVRINKPRGKQRGGLSRLKMRRDAICAGFFNKMLLSLLPVYPLTPSTVTQRLPSTGCWGGGVFPPLHFLFSDEKRCNYTSACWSESSNNKP